MGQQISMNKPAAPVKQQQVRESMITLPGSYMMNGQSAGFIKLHERTISSIVKRAALSVDGVSRLSGSNFIDNIAELVGSKKIQERAITVKVENNVLYIEISVNFFFGSNLPRVAAEIQHCVSNAIFTMTGIRPAKIDINFREVEDAAPEEQETDETESDNLPHKAN